MRASKNRKKKIIGWTIISSLVGIIVLVSSIVFSDFTDTEAQTGPVLGTVTNSIEFEQKTTQDQVVSTMHKMTHQFIVAEEKWGAVPMTPSTISEVRSVIEKNDFKEKTILLEIIRKWEAKDFDDIDEDHNYLWTLQEGTAGKATGIMAPEDQEAFIKNNFDKSVVQELGFQ